MNEKVTCACCHNAKVQNTCGLCAGAICKGCTEFFGVEALSFMRAIPAELSHNHYCPRCFISAVKPAVQNYKETMKRAKGILFLDKPSRKPLPFLKRCEKPIQVTGCPDREETILRLGFLAAELGYNAVIRAKVEYKKIRNAGYQKMEWSGVGYPATLDGERLERQTD